jgi:phosphatidylglycerophosphate synthase
MFLVIKNAVIEKKSWPVLGFVIRHSANLLTSFRLYLAALIIILLWFNPKRTGFWDNPLEWWNPATDGLALFSYFVIAGATDYADGKLARFLEIVSNFGMMFDKTADKILTIPVFAFMLRCFVWLWHSHDLSRLSTAMLTFLVATDALIFVIGTMLGLLGIRIDTSNAGKRKMKWQCISGGCWILLVLLLGVRAGNQSLLLSMPFLLALPMFYCYKSARGYMGDAIAAFRDYWAKKEYRLLIKKLATAIRSYC